MDNKSATNIAITYLEATEPPQFTLTKDLLALVDWDLVKDHFEQRETCCVCGIDEQLSWLVDDTGAPRFDWWLLHKGLWYCPDCRDEMPAKSPDWHVCEGCDLAYPDEYVTWLTHTLEGDGFFCDECAEAVTFESGDILVDKAGREYYQVLSLAPTFSETQGTMVHVLWYKHGIKSYEELLANYHVQIPLRILRKPTMQEKQIWEEQKNAD